MAMMAMLSTESLNLWLMVVFATSLHAFVNGNCFSLLNLAGFLASLHYWTECNYTLCAFVFLILHNCLWLICFWEEVHLGIIFSICLTKQLYI